MDCGVGGSYVNELADTDGGRGNGYGGGWQIRYIFSSGRGRYKTEDWFKDKSTIPFANYGPVLRVQYLFLVRITSIIQRSEDCSIVNQIFQFLVVLIKN